MAKIPVDADILAPSDDHIFKAILTHPDAEEALISLTSAVLERTVAKVYVRNNELPASDDSEKNERLDVNCVVDGGTQVDIEMQASSLVEVTNDVHKSFINKHIYYMTDLHSSQKSKGVRYCDFVRTYQVTFCMHPVFPDWPDFVSRVSMRRPNGEQISDQINMVVVEMSKLYSAIERPPESLTPLEMWSIFFGFAPDQQYRDYINKIIEIKKEVGMASTLLMEISKDEHERARFMSRRKAQTDRDSDLATAKKNGQDEVLALIRQGLSLAEIEKVLTQKYTPEEP